MAAAVAKGSMSTTLLAYSLSTAEVPAARCSRSLKGCVSALRPLEPLSASDDSLSTSGKRSTRLSASCSLPTSSCISEASLRTPRGATSSARCGGGGTVAAPAAGGSDGALRPRKTWQTALSRSLRRSTSAAASRCLPPPPPPLPSALPPPPQTPTTKTPPPPLLPPNLPTLLLPPTSSPPLPAPRLLPLQVYHQTCPLQAAIPRSRHSPPSLTHGK
mmetsp:Transcript_9221/g.20176  ORF Transcript_9221/g.20176 Transcript_9221/m.20176 type:complete len:217 (+) Transcript_9221:3362-4012(+)